MYQVNDLVKPKHPFNVPFNGVYSVERIEIVNGLPVYFLVGIEGGFDESWLEAA